MFIHNLPLPRVALYFVPFVAVYWKMWRQRALGWTTVVVM